jgi:hypothetical protein
VSGSTIDRLSRDAAVRDAARTGMPQPVRARSGKIIYWVDPAGRRLENDAHSNQPKGWASDPSKLGLPAVTKAGADKTRKRVADEAAATAKAKDDAERTKNLAHAAGDAVNAANQAMGYVWVDGKQMRVVQVDGNGAYTVQVDGGKPGPLAQTTAYGALNSDAIDGGTRFTLSYGQGDIFDGQAAGAHRYTPAGAGATGAAAEHSAAANQVGNTTNMVTIQEGLQRLANLAASDPAAYAAMVDRLHRARYLTDDQYAKAGGGYSNIVGAAFAAAATDTAVINGTPAGVHTTLDQLLDQKAAAGDKQDADTYKPVQRTYTDPDAIKAQAKSAAEAALGRQLTDEEAARLTGHFRSLENAEYDQIDAAGRNKQNASVTDPNVTGQIDAFLDSNSEQEQANYRAAGYGQALMKLFGVNA